MSEKMLRSVVEITGLKYMATPCLTYYGDLCDGCLGNS